MADPIDMLVADGRFTPQPEPYYQYVAVAEIDLDIMTARLRMIIRSVYLHWDALRNLYSGPDRDKTNRISIGIDAMLDLLMAVFYNRLRSVLEVCAPVERQNRMNPRAPVDTRLEFPLFLATMLSKVGMTRVRDNLLDTMIVYSTVAARANTFGRAQVRPMNAPRYEELKDKLRKCGVTFGSIDRTNFNGTLWPTLSLDITNGIFTVFTGFNPAGYDREDIVYALHFGPLASQLNPFEDVTWAICKVEDAAVIAAITAAPAPAGMQAGVAGIGPYRYVGGLYRTDPFGLTEAVAAVGTTPASPAAIYVVGRGLESLNSHTLCRNINVVDHFNIMAYRYRK